MQAVTTIGLDIAKSVFCHCKIKILDAGEMLKDVLAVIVPHVDSMRESLSVLALHCPPSGGRPLHHCG
jgi:hypothetical protein